jgi:hypothetical protein
MPEALEQLERCDADLRKGKEQTDTHVSSQCGENALALSGSQLTLRGWDLSR